jgi:hypothetical protein
VQAVQRLFSLSPVAAVPARDDAAEAGAMKIDKKAAGS